MTDEQFSDLTPARILKGDLDYSLYPNGSIRYAQVIDPSVLAWLIARQILDPSATDYATSYMTCKSAWRAARGERTHRSCLNNLIPAGGAMSCDQAADVYSLTRKWLGAEYVQTVEYAWHTDYDPANTRHLTFRYRDAFHALAKCYEDAVDEVRERKKK